MLLWAAGDEGGDVACSEAVVDVDDGDVGATGVEHAQQGGDSFKGCAVADAGGDGDYGDFYETTDDGGESSFHAGAADDGVGCAESVELGEQTVEAGDSNIGDAGDLCAEEFGGDGGFFCDGEVAGAGTDTGDAT